MVVSRILAEVYLHAEGDGEGEESVLGKKKTVASTFKSELMCGFVEKCLENDVLHDEWKKHIYIHSS